MSLNCSSKSDYCTVWGWVGQVFLPLRTEAKLIPKTDSEAKARGILRVHETEQDDLVEGMTWTTCGLGCDQVTTMLM